MPTTRLILGDCVERLRELADCSVDAVVTDPPYGLSFMGKKWDYDVPSEDVWRECLRVLKPGGHLLAFAGTRTQHRMAVRIEDAGFEIRDMIAWVYGSGFPKSHDVSKAIHAHNTVGGSSPKKRRESIMGDAYTWSSTYGKSNTERAMKTPRKGKQDVLVDLDDLARDWQGWGTALKPSWECVTMARKPLVGTVAANVLEHGTGALNIDGCRVGTEIIYQRQVQRIDGGAGIGAAAVGQKQAQSGMITTTVGRWPANLIHDGSEEVTDLLGESARFFYCSKASKRDRDEGLEDAPDRILAMSNQAKAELARGNMHEGESGMNTAKMRKNNHPTVKPTELMRYLCRLVTPPGGTVLDPFMGSGSTGKAAVLEGFGFIGIEREEEYLEIAKARIGAADPLFQLTASV